MNWQQIDKMPCVISVLENAKQQIKDLTGADVMVGLVDLGPVDRKKKYLQQVVSSYFKIDWDIILSKNRNQKIVNARHVYVYFARQMGCTLEDIGKDINRHHSTMTYALAKTAGFIDVSDDIAKDIETIRQILFNS